MSSNCLPDKDVKIIDLLAAAAHEQWAAWQRFADTVKDQATYENLTETIEISEAKWQNWNRKAFLDFSELTPQEQKSDYEIAEKILAPAIKKWLTTKRRIIIKKPDEKLSLHEIYLRKQKNKFIGELLGDLKI